MRILIIAVIALVSAVYAGLELEKNPGLFQIQYGETSRTVSGVVAVAYALVAIGIIYVAIRLLGALWRTPKTMRRFGQKRRLNAARQSLSRGMIALAQGHWKQAAKELDCATDHAETAVLGYLASARAAQALGRTEQRDRLLDMAQRRAPTGQMAVAITQAQLLIENQELEKAAHQLRNVHKHDPKNKLVLELLKECYLQSHDWKELAAIMPALQKSGSVRPDEVLHLQRNAYTHILATAANTGSDTRALDAAWQGTPHSLRRDPQLLTIYVRSLMEHGEGTRPEAMLRNKLGSQWDDQLVYLYGIVNSKNPARQLHTAEHWLRRHSDDATLLLTLGRLALRNHLWAKARTYLERSLEIDPRPETYMLLGKLLEQSGDKLIAGEIFRKGLGITVGKDALLLERNPIESSAPGLPATGGGMTLAGAS